MTNRIKQKLIILFHYLRTKRRKFKSRTAFEKWQQKQLFKFKHKILKQSPYYSAYVDKDLSAIPIIQKKQHMQLFDQINTRHIKLEDALARAKYNEENREFHHDMAQFSVGLSSGTSGKHGVFVTTQQEQTLWAGYILAKLLPNICKKEKIALFLRADNNLYSSVTSSRISFHFFDLFKPFDDLLNALMALNPTIIVAPARVLTLIAQAQGKSITINPKKIISCAETLEASNKKFIESTFNLTLSEIYQCTEGFLATTCEQGNMHLNEDNIYIEKEWLDKDSNRFMPIITDFRRSTQPIVRYLLDDILTLSLTPCTCGSVLQRIEKIEGRCDDIIKLIDHSGNKVNLFPDFIRRIFLLKSVNVNAYQIEQISTNEINVYIDPINLQVKQFVTQSFIELCQKMNVIPPNFNYFNYQAPPLDKKFRRISSLIKK